MLIAVAGYFFYEKHLTKKSLSPWDIVPGNALLVYEGDDCSSCIESLTQSSVWKVILEACNFDKPIDSVQRQLNKVIGSTSKILISLHATKKDDFDFIFFIPYAQKELAHLSDLSKNKKFKSTYRTFSNVEIHEISFSGEIFSWAQLDNQWVGSFTPFLIEDVIRTFRFAKPAFKKNQVSMPSVKGDGGNLFVQLSTFSECLSLFSTGNSALLESLGKASILDIKSDPTKILLNGFSIDSVDYTKYVLSIFHNQSPVSFNLKHIISQRTLSLHSFGISDAELFWRDLEVFVKKKNPHLKDSLEQINLKLKINLSSLYKTIDDEIGVCFLESSKSKSLSKILIIETKDVTPWLKTFKTLSEKLSVDTVFYDHYSNYEIREVPVFRLPEKLFWPLVSGFDQSFYTAIGNTIFIGDDLDELKRFLNDIEEDETWSKSVAYNKFMESTLLESNINIYFNTPKIWNVFTQHLRPRWRQFVKENEVMLRSLQFGAIQFSHLNNSYYTNISLNYKPLIVNKGTTNNKKKDRFITNFDSGIASLHSVKSHVNRSDEILIQDSLGILSLISNEGSVIWKLDLGGKIIGEVTQIDFFANGKLQYLFATKDSLYIIDRTGNYVNPYPIKIPSDNITFVSIFDYDHSKNYRFLITDNNGKIWMYDKDGNNLEGWAPKNIGGILATSPQHHRIKGKDYIISIGKDGVVYLMNRKGEMIKNFPLKLDARLNGDYFLERGSSNSENHFIVVSADGFRIKFSIDGKIQSRETLMKTSVSGQFGLIKEQSNKSYLILQQDVRQLNLLDENQKRIISNEYIGLNPVKVKYYDFGNGMVFISITDTIQGLTYIYNSSGDLLSSPPIETSLLELRPLDNDELKLFSIEGRSLVIEPL